MANDSRGNPRNSNRPGPQRTVKHVPPFTAQPGRKLPQAWIDEIEAAGGDPNDPKTFRRTPLRRQD